MRFDIVSFVDGLAPGDGMPRMPAEEYRGRIETIRGLLAARKLDTAVAFGTEYRPGDTGGSQATTRTSRARSS